MVEGEGRACGVEMAPDVSQAREKRPKEGGGGTIMGSSGLSREPAVKIWGNREVKVAQEQAVRKSGHLWEKGRVEEGCPSLSASARPI